MGADSTFVHIFIAEIEISELYFHIYYISLHNEFENSWIYIEQSLKQEFNLDEINWVGCANFKSVFRLVTRGNYMHISIICIFKEI